MKIVMNLSSTIRLYMNILILWTLDALQEMILFWNGIDFYAEFMEEVVALTISTRLIPKKVFTNKKSKLERV